MAGDGGMLWPPTQVQVSWVFKQINADVLGFNARFDTPQVRGDSPRQHGTGQQISHPQFPVIA
jgi:hypothetical protein